MYIPFRAERNDILSVNLGRVAYVDQGPYSDSVSYKRKDVVQYDGGSYVLTGADLALAIPPTEDAYWTPMLDPAQMNAATQRALAAARAAEGAGGNGGTVTPEMYGAVGDGVHDDAPALQAALESGRPVVLSHDLWLFSEIIIKDHSVDLDGMHHTLHCHKAGISIAASTWTPAESQRVGACSKVSNAVQSEYEAQRSPYHQGYLTYEGRKTLAEEYDEYTVTYFDLYSAHLRNFDMICENMDYGNGKGMCALSLYYLCNSSVEHVRTILKDGEEGSVGICCVYCQNMRIDHCHSQGWICAKNGALADVRGYGFQLIGDNICLSHSSGEQCKHCVTVGSSKDIWNTNITIDHCNFRTDFTKLQREDGSCYFMQQLDVHGDARNVTVTGCNFYWWCLDGNNMSAAVIAIRNPVTVIANCNVYSNGAWINFGEFAQSVHIDQLYAPAVHLTCNFRIGGDHNKENFMPELHVSNSEFARLRDATSPTRVYLTHCIIREMVMDVQYLVARGCIFARENPWASQPTLVLTGESILSDCVIWGHRENAISKRTPIIRAPEKSVHMNHCKIYKRQGDYALFNTEQEEGTGNWYEDVFAFYLDTQHELDKNNLQ